MAKQAYRVRNWSEYNKALVNRGSLTFWFTEEIIKNWSGDGSVKRHGNQRYSDECIICALTLRQLYRLPLRTTRGLLCSMLDMMGLTLKTPCYTTLSRRGRDLPINLQVSQTTNARHVLVDSTGVQVIGEGEWKKLRHGDSRYQLWRKLHLSVDADSHEILGATMTESVRLDGNYIDELIDPIEGDIKQITGDGAYDKKSCYQKAFQRQAKPVFPPQHNACPQRNKIKKNPALAPRDSAIAYINKDKQRLKAWKLDNNYHRRSLVETMMARMKSIFGDKMRSKNLTNQKTDLLIRCRAMNLITSLGMPKSEPI